MLKGLTVTDLYAILSVIAYAKESKYNLEPENFYMIHQGRQEAYSIKQLTQILWN